MYVWIQIGLFQLCGAVCVISIAALCTVLIQWGGWSHLLAEATWGRVCAERNGLQIVAGSVYSVHSCFITEFVLRGFDWTVNALMIYCGSFWLYLKMVGNCRGWGGGVWLYINKFSWLPDASYPYLHTTTKVLFTFDTLHCVYFQRDVWHMQVFLLRQKMCLNWRRIVRLKNPTPVERIKPQQQNTNNR